MIEPDCSKESGDMVNLQIWVLAARAGIWVLLGGAAACKFFYIFKFHIFKNF
jgi:hypothetical protein